MKTFQKTLPGGKNKHRHLVYLDDELGIVGVSVTQGHSHEGRWVPPMPPAEAQYDEFGNLLVEEEPGHEGYFEILPAKDGHTHELGTEIELKNPFTDDRSDSEIVAEVFQEFETWTDFERESLELGEEAEEMVAGFQWDEDTLQRLTKEERACLTLNYLEHEVDYLSGHQRDVRTDLRYLPGESTDQVKADILNVISKHILDKCNYVYEESEVFEDQIIAGRGIFSVDIEFDDDIQGDIVVRQRPWKDVRFGPHKRKDLHDLEGYVDHEMFSVEDLANLYPKLRDDIETSMSHLKLIGQDVSTDEHTTETDRFSAVHRVPYMIGTHAMWDIRTKELRVLERWKKIYIRTAVIVNSEYDVLHNAYGWSKGDLKAVKTIPGFQVVERPTKKIRITKCCRGVLLSDELPADLPRDDFYIAVAYCKKKGDLFWGKIRRAIDAQKELNKRRSQAIDFANRALGDGWFYDHSTFPDGEKDKFRQKASRTSWTQEINSVDRPPKRESGARIPPEVMEGAAAAQATIKDLVSVQAESQGANDSGSKLLTLQQEKLRGNEFLFDNMSIAKKRIGRLLVGLIQRYYPPDRVARIVMAKAEREGIKLGDQPISDFTEEQIATLYEETDIDTLDVITTEGAYSPSAKLGNLLIMSESVRNGAAIPPKVLIKQMDMPESEKAETLATLDAEAEAASAASIATADAEIAKTLIAQGHIPPEISRKFGLVQGGLGEAPLPGSPQQMGAMNGEAGSGLEGAIPGGVPTV